MPVKTPSRQVLILAALVVGLGVVLAYNFLGSSSAPAARPGSVKPVASREAVARDRAASAPDVRLTALKAVKAMPAAKGRNLFRELPKAPPPPPPRVVTQAPPPDPNAPQLPPPPPPPITLKLVAIVQGSGKPVVALTDGRDMFYGREGDVIEGRYRIVKVNVESIDIAYVDGRGQRRLSLVG
jgi:hypothetical protein